MTRRCIVLNLVSLVAALTLANTSACGDDDTRLSVEELMKPETCLQCHPKHYKEWSGSMHAYAADDPVFIAMNKRGQRETNGALGSFCINCHAPMAVQLGLTTDGSNLAELPQWSKGVTCYFCHNVKAITDTHNNPITLFNDDVMRGGITDPVKSPAHRTEYSELVDADNQQSSAMCGACHDIVTPRNVHLERTFAEWQTTIFALPDPRQHLTCGQCHMIATDDVIASAPGLKVPLRQQGRREHTFAGIDTALTPWPEMAEQRAAIDRDLKGVVAAKLCVVPTNGGEITMRLDNIGGGHMFPSGAAHDRRAWVELVAYDSNDQIVFQSGVVPDDKDPEDIADPNLFFMWDKTFKSDNTPADFFWDVARYESFLLKPAVTLDFNDPRYDHATTHSYVVGPARAQIVKVTAVVKIRALPLHLMRELLSDGLPSSAITNLPTLELSGTKLTWTPGAATNLCVD